MGFHVKHFLGEVLMPLPGLLAIAFIGLFLLARSQRFKSKILRSSGWWLTAAAVSTLYLIALPVFSPASDNEVAPIHHDPLPDSIEFIVVLGGGSNPDPRLSAVNQLGESSLARLIEGLRVHRLHPGSTLILSEGGPLGVPTTASVMRGAAAELGFDTSSFVLEQRSRDTIDQAAFVSELVGERPVAIVTSVSHMPRAMLTFRQRGLDPFPIYADFEAQTSAYRGYKLFVPTPGGLSDATRVWHEFLGSLYTRLTSLLR